MVGPPPGPPSAVLGHSYVLQGVEHAPLLHGVEAKLSFTDRDLSAHAFCNHLFGFYRVERGRLIVSGMGGTEMGCDPLGSARDRWLIAFLGSRPKLHVCGATLTLENATSRLVLLDKAVAEPDPPLAGTVWETNSYIDGDTAMGLMETRAPSLLFLQDGTWTLQGVCSQGRGTYTADEDRLTLANAAFEQASPDCGNDNEREAAAFTEKVLLQGTLGYRIESGSLELTGQPLSLGLNQKPR